MIRFALKCANGHGFESWFASNEKFETLLAQGFVTCPVCQNDEVNKELMAPRVRASRRAAEPEVAKGEQPMAMGDPDTTEAIKMLKAHVEANSDYVGDQFAAEARAMHDGAMPHRSIHGQARPEEAKKLMEDGVPALPLPFIPRQKTN